MSQLEISYKKITIIGLWLVTENANQTHRIPISDSWLVTVNIAKCVD